MLLAFFCAGCSAEIETPSAGQDFTSVPPGAGQTNDSIAAGEEYRAVWISYLEWQRLAGCDEAAFRENVAAMLQNCADLGLNTVIAQVRPFGDALYQSELFPTGYSSPKICPLSWPTPTPLCFIPTGCSRPTAGSTMTPACPRCASWWWTG